MVCLSKFFKSFKGCLPQNLLGPFLNTLSHILSSLSKEFRDIRNNVKKNFPSILCGTWKSLMFCALHWLAQILTYQIETWRNWRSLLLWLSYDVMNTCWSDYFRLLLWISRPYWVSTQRNIPGLAVTKKSLLMNFSGSFSRHWKVMWKSLGPAFFLYKNNLSKSDEADTYQKLTTN